MYYFYTDKPLFTMEAQNSLKNWFYSIPPFSRTYLVILLLMGFGSSMGFVDPFILMFSPTLIFKRFEVVLSGNYEE